VDLLFSQPLSYLCSYGHCGANEIVGYRNDVFVSRDHSTSTEDEICSSKEQSALAANSMSTLLRRQTDELPESNIADDQTSPIQQRFYEAARIIAKATSRVAHE